MSVSRRQFVQDVVVLLSGIWNLVKIWTKKHPEEFHFFEFGYDVVVARNKDEACGYMHDLNGPFSVHEICGYPIQIPAHVVPSRYRLEDRSHMMASGDGETLVQYPTALKNDLAMGVTVPYLFASSEY